MKDSTGLMFMVVFCPSKADFLVLANVNVKFGPKALLSCRAFVDAVRSPRVGHWGTVLFKTFVWGSIRTRFPGWSWSS